MCNKCLREEAEYRATGKHPPSGGGGCAGWPAKQIVNSSGEYPPIGRVVHVPDQKPKVTINNNIPNSTVTVQEVDGEIIVTITEAPKHEEFNKR